MTHAWLDELRALIVLVFYAATVIAITTHRIFDARQLVLVALQKLALIVLVSASAYGIHLLLTFVFPEFFAFVFTVALTLWLVAIFGAWLNNVLQFNHRLLAPASCGRSGTARSRLENLEPAFLEYLKGGHSDHALLLSAAKINCVAEVLRFRRRESLSPRSAIALGYSRASGSRESQPEVSP